MGLELVISVLILLISLIVLNKASHMTITNAVKVSEISGFGKTTIGFTLIAFSTSLPELSVAVIAAFLNVASVSIGNILGSNVVNICLIVGVGLLLATFKHSKPLDDIVPSMPKRELESFYSGLFVASIIPISLLYIAYASQLIGFILLTIFAIYTYQLLREKRPMEETDGNAPKEEGSKLRRYTLLTFVGIAGVIASSYFIVDSASSIAETLGVPQSLIAATIIAFGTSLPELSISVGAFVKGEPGIALGNIIGSCFFNITCILGVTLVTSPLVINMGVFSELVTFAIISNILLWYFLNVGKLGWRERAILLFIYALFLAITFGVIQVR